MEKWTFGTLKCVLCREVISIVSSSWRVLYRRFHCNAILDVISPGTFLITIHVHVVMYTIHARICTLYMYIYDLITLLKRCILHQQKCILETKKLGCCNWDKLVHVHVCIHVFSPCSHESKVQWSERFPLFLGL